GPAAGRHLLRLPRDRRPDGLRRLLPAATRRAAGRTRTRRRLRRRGRRLGQDLVRRRTLGPRAGARAPRALSQGRFVNRLQGKAALVTGGARGIGSAIAQRFAEEGAAVAVLALHADSAARAVDEITDRGGRAIGIAGDVAAERDVETAVAEAVAAFGRLDVMVNNAATIAIGPVADISVEAWARLL